jgi:hypothetical protein
VLLIGNATILCWGDNSHGQLGTGDTRPILTETAVLELGSGMLIYIYIRTVTISSMIILVHDTLPEINPHIEMNMINHRRRALSQ